MRYGVVKNTFWLLLTVMSVTGDAVKKTREVLKPQSSNSNAAGHEDLGNNVATMYAGTDMNQLPTALVAVTSVPCNNLTNSAITKQFLDPIAGLVQGECGQHNNRSLSFPGFANMTTWICENFLFQQVALTVKQLCTSGLFGKLCLQTGSREIDQNTTIYSAYVAGFTASGAPVEPVVNNSKILCM